MKRHEIPPNGTVVIFMIPPECVELDDKLQEGEAFLVESGTIPEYIWLRSLVNDLIHLTVQEGWDAAEIGLEVRG